MEKISADADLEGRLNAIRQIQGNNPAALDAATARNILHEELGRFTDPQTIYHLDEATRDRLLAHSRQDAAHALLTALRSSKDIAEVKRLLKIAVILLLVITAVTVFSLFR